MHLKHVFAIIVTDQILTVCEYLSYDERGPLSRLTLVNFAQFPRVFYALLDYFRSEFALAKAVIFAAHFVFDRVSDDCGRVTAQQMIENEPSKPVSHERVCVFDDRKRQILHISLGCVLR